jgi:hypothetical protein
VTVFRHSFPFFNLYDKESESMNEWTMERLEFVQNQAEGAGICGILLGQEEIIRRSQEITAGRGEAGFHIEANLAPPAPSHARADSERKRPLHQPERSEPFQIGDSVYKRVYLKRKKTGKKEADEPQTCGRDNDCPKTGRK